MKACNLIFSIFLQILNFSQLVLSQYQYKVHTLDGNVTIEHNSALRSSVLDIYCFTPNQRHLKYTWKSVYLYLKVTNDAYTQYEGSSAEIVWQAFKDDNSFWSFNTLWTDNSNYRIIDPFKSSCLAIKTRESYKLQLQNIDVDNRRIMLMIVGVVLFMYSRTLGENPIFFYLAGVSIGICASFMILVYFISRMLPGKPIVYGAMIGGWTVGFYALQFIWSNFKPIMMAHHEYFMWYALITGFISFIVCYRMGPPENQRSKNLITWTLQLIGIAFLYFGTYLWESVIIATVILCIAKYVPFDKLAKIPNYSIFKKQEIPKLLTKEEYEEQASAETARALAELRGYCSSPECPSWKIIRKLKDPKRFADFIDGEDHLSDGEVSEHEKMLEYSFRRKSTNRTPKRNGNGSLRKIKTPEFTSDESSSSSDEL